MGRYFGTNGMRGVFGSGITVGTACRMAAAVGARLGRGPVLVGRDGRWSGPALLRAATSGICSAGLDCADAGLVPTPCLEYAVKKLGYAGGIMVTASHNPPEYGGIKPVAADGVEFSRDDEDATEDIYDSGGPAPGRWGSRREEDGAVGAYLGGVASEVDADAIRAAGCGVVIDAGNGAQARVAPELCRMLGVNTRVINGDVDGAFPGRGPEPTPENLGALSEAVREEGASLGVAFDGDGDRSVFCDGDGRILTGDRSALVMARSILASSPGSLVVTCHNSGSAIEEVAAESGSRVARTRVGSVEVSRRMVKDGALVGFEENGGFMYGRHNQVRDGCMALALMLGIAARSGISDAAAALPVSHTGKTKILCKPGSMRDAMARIAAANPGCDTGDGIRVEEGPRDWAMIRASGTEPVIRVYAEGSTGAELESRLARFERMVRDHLTGA
ncbi:MAG: phosphoglucosamine mutase [Nitrosopumilus sp.]|nr:phosphoglucosamine mutase [Nitrosopumilus sp.]MDA7943904.1 phosphoglucosamine mutase [Nitrosopumilus sp.]MDA7959938.1 phosphoglucosamine mutase [Nitrosopumilus sp.]MDA7998961.1 phosphoglucosamine mutase [Nitrosopumilus sp.]